MTALGVSLFVVFAATAYASVQVTVPGNYSSTVKGLIAQCTPTMLRMTDCTYAPVYITIIKKAKIAHKQTYLNYLYALKAACSAIDTGVGELYSAQVLTQASTQNAHRDWLSFACNWGKDILKLSRQVEIDLPLPGQRIKFTVDCSAPEALSHCVTLPGGGIESHGSSPGGGWGIGIFRPTGGVSIGLGTGHINHTAVETSLFNQLVKTFGLNH